MSNDLNHCSFIGRLGKDPDVRYTADGAAIVNFSIAVGSKYKDKESTEWVRMVAFGKRGEICAEYLKKGKQIYASGRLQTRKWQDKEGQDRYTTEVVLEQMQMLGGRSDGDEPAAPRPAPREQKADAGRVGDMDDDIPF